MIPIVHSFCFTSDGQVFSYDDILLERVGGVPTELGVAVPRVLWDLLQGFDEKKELKLSTEKDNSLRVKVGRMKADLPILDASNFLLKKEEVAEFGGKTLCSIPMEKLPELVDGLQFCIDCFLFNPAVARQSGIVLQVGAKGMRFYATDNTTLTRFQATTSTKIKEELQCIVPPRFLSELLRYKGLLSSKRWNNGVFTIGKEVVRAEFGKVLLAAKVKPLEDTAMDELIAQHKPAKALVKITPALRLATERTMLVAGESGEISITPNLEENGCRLQATTDGVGSIVERVPTLNLSKEYMVDGKKFARAMAKCDTLTESKNAIIFYAGESILHLVATK